VSLICRPAKWLWGLPALIFVTAFALYGTNRQIERDLAEQAAAALQDAELQWAIARFEGRDAILEGLSFSGKERDAALRIVGDIWGVRKVVDNSDLIATPETYSWFARKDENRIKIRGHVPTKSDRQAIIGFIKAAMPDLEVDDKMIFAGGSPAREQWLGSVSFALVQLGQLKKGAVQLSGPNLSVQGEAKSSEAYRIITSPVGQLPKGVKLNVKNVAPPVVEPFVWRAKFTGSLLSFSGFVPSEKTREQILQRAKTLFPDTKVEDGMEIASGAPEDWLWAVSASMIELHRLESGRIKIDDTELELSGIAADERTIKDVTQSIQYSLPNAYSVREKLTARIDKAADKPTTN